LGDSIRREAIERFLVFALLRIMVGEEAREMRSRATGLLKKEHKAGGQAGRAGVVKVFDKMTQRRVSE
jgi:hypothetical protein